MHRLSRTEASGGVLPCARQCRRTSVPLPVLRPSGRTSTHNAWQAQGALMPSRPRRPCSTPGCSQLLAPGASCPTHRRHARRTSTSKRGGYDSGWQRFRRRYLYENAWCVLCGARATDVDHYPRSRAQLIDAGESNPDQPRFVRSLCHRCHSRETGRLQSGGIVASRQVQTAADRVLKRWT